MGICVLYHASQRKNGLDRKRSDASIFSGKNSSFLGPLTTLKLGMFLAGIALGILAGGLLETLTTLDEGIGYTSMIFLFGGLSLVLFYAYARKRQS
jgi:hypothetical protein